MGKFMKKIMVGITAAAMLLTTVLTWLPPLGVLAAESTVAHLVSGSSNGN